MKYVNLTFFHSFIISLLDDSLLYEDLLQDND